MAQQKGLIKFKGTIGDITFYKSKDGFMAREKGGITGDRIANDPNFQRTRENGAEFGRAGNAGKVLRTSLKALLQNTADSKMVSRLTKQMMKVIHADLNSPRGERNVIDGEITLLEGFDFNVNSNLSTTFFAPFTGSIDRATGTLTANIPSYIPMHMIAAPQGATHYKIISAGVEIDFTNGTYTAYTAFSDELPWNANPTTNLELENTVTANSTKPLFLALGIEFFQEVNSLMYPLKNGGFNSLCLVKVSNS